MQEEQEETTTAAEVWSEIQGRIKTQVDEAVWHSTFSQIQLKGLYQSELILVVNSKHLEKRLLLEENTQILREHFDEMNRQRENPITYQILAVIENASLPLPIPTTTKEVPAEENQEEPWPTRPPVPRDSLNPIYTFENFVAGDKTRFALGACQAVAENIGGVYNPLFLYGEVGLGKTHLLQAIAHFVTKIFPGHLVRYSTTEKFIDSFVRAIRNKQTEKFQKHYRNVDILLLDDMQFLEGKEGSQIELFNTFNELFTAGKQIVFAADRSPTKLTQLDERIKSRCKSGLVVDVSVPEIETRIAILKLKAQKIHFPEMKFDEAVFDFIAEHFQENIRELEGALIRVAAKVKIESKSGSNPRVTRMLAEEALSEFIKGEPSNPLTTGSIVKACAKYLRCSPESILGPKRTKPLVTARHLVMYVIRSTTELSYPEIGSAFGRDHTSIIHAVRKIEKEMHNDERLLAQITELQRIIKIHDKTYFQESEEAA